MPQSSTHQIALDLLREWEDGNTSSLEDHVARFAGDSREVVDLVADCLILDALACPTLPSVPTPVNA